ncbi:MAG: periplasmic heavy metal sensor [Pseudomonadota bacterium]
MIKRPVIIVSALLLSSGSALAESKPSQPYAGQDKRTVSSLSPADLTAISKGQGWGLAKPAELNGYPGPIHVLELADRLELSKAQISQVREIYSKMNANARRIGKAFIQSEAELDALFKTGSATPKALKRALAKTSQLRADLREAHLDAHIRTVPILTQHQRHLYAQLRGYSNKGSHSGHAH